MTIRAQLIRLSFVFIGLFLAGCMSWKQSTPHVDEGKYCRFKRHVLSIGGNAPTPVTRLMTRTSPEVRSDPCLDNTGNFEQSMWCALSDIDRSPPMPITGGPVPTGEPVPLYASRPKTRPMLFLSGGNLNGAFGAGFLQGWAEKRGVLRADQRPWPGENPPQPKYALPDFAVVTGVSTGALLSLSAYAGIPEAASDGYEIEGEHEVLDVFISPRGQSSPIMDALAALNNGAATDLGPMRNSLIEIVDKYNLIGRIAEKTSRQKTKLYVGVVDLDTGGAVALDMTDMASRIVAASQIGDQSLHQRYRNCFFDAIVASSAVPLAARPVSIDNRLYIDGGARFLVFTDQVGPILRDHPRKKYTATDEPIKRNVYTIINGDQTLEAVCKKKNPADCYEGVSSLRGARKDWTLLDVAVRAVDVLQSQVKEYSEHDVKNQTAQQAGAKYHGVKLKPEYLDYPYYDAAAGQTLPCREWIEYDKQVYGAQKFHKTYMRCLIASGRAQGIIKNWGE